MFKGSRFIAVLTAGLLLAAAGSVQAGARIEKELDLAPGGRFVLDTDGGKVTVTGSGRSGARIVITARTDDLEDLYDFDFDSSASGLEVTVEKKSRGSWFSWGGRRHGLEFEIELPSDTEIDIDTAGGSITAENFLRDARLDTSGGNIHALRIGGELLADTSGGNIVVEDVGGDVNADTSGGNIEVEGARGDVLADTSGGNIAISDVTGDVEADTSGGSIRISDVGGRVDADPSGGTVTASFAAGNFRGGRLATSGGSIRIQLDPSANLDLDAAASGGSVTVSGFAIKGKITKSHVRGTIGGGGAELVLRTSGGGIRIEPL